MSSGGYPISRQLLEALKGLFGDPGNGLNVLGVERPEIFLDLYEEVLPVSQDVFERASRLRSRLETYLEQMAAESAELGSESETQRLRAEAVGLLIALRELRRHLPEVF